MGNIFFFIIIFLLLFSIFGCAPLPVQDIETPEQEQEVEPVPEPESQPDAVQPINNQTEVQEAEHQAGPEILETSEKNKTSSQQPETKPGPETMPDALTSSDLEHALNEITMEERAEPIVHYLLQNERGVYTYGNRRYVIYFRNVLDPNTAEMRIEGQTMDVTLGDTIRLGQRYELTLVGISSGRSALVGDLVKFYYGTRAGLISDYIEEGETKSYLRNGKKYIITLVSVSDIPDEPRALFEINGQQTDVLGQKDQEIFDDRSFLFVSNIYPNEAREFTSQKAVEFTITRTEN